MTTLQALGDEMLLSRDTLTKAWVTGRPQVSDIVTWPVSQRQTAFIAYPVFKDGRRRPQPGTVVCPYRKEVRRAGDDRGDRPQLQIPRSNTGSQ